MENDVYGFTTTLTDNYLDRVVAEALPETNFLAICEKRTDGPVNEPSLSNLMVLFRYSYLEQLADKDPEFEFLGNPVGEIVLERTVGLALGKTLLLEDWVIYTLDELDEEALDKAMTSAVHTMNRVDNLVSGRIVKVNVLAL